MIIPRIRKPVVFRFYGHKDSGYYLIRDGNFQGKVFSLKQTMRLRCSGYFEDVSAGYVNPGCDQLNRQLPDLWDKVGRGGRLHNAHTDRWYRRR